ncbi:MAG: hypothetical protein FJ134_14220 [Deltaproteobacteria bacterium]|nr:hypothetical protein [Deltaproteobacteria bacterium]
MEDNKDDSRKALERAKARTQSEAERIFNQYCYPGTWFWAYPEWKQAALDILNSGICEGIELKGHARRQNYPIALGDLIIALVQMHFDYDVDRYLPRFHRLEGPLKEEIVGEFDEHFRFVAAIARLGGIRSDSVQKIWDDWRKRITARAVKGEIPHQWRLIIMDDMYPGRGYAPPKTPLETARKFAEVFLQYVPPEAEAPPGRIVEWVHLTLKSLGRPTGSKSKLHDYISERKQRLLTPISII